MRQRTRTYRNVVVGLLLTVTLAGCLDDSAESADVNNIAPPPTSTNTAPEIWGSAPRVVKVGVDYSFTPQATDADGDPLSFSINNRPAWLTFDATSGRISGVPLMGNEGTYNDIEIAVSDGQVSTMLPRFSINVEPISTPNMPPEIDGTPATSVAVGNNYTFTPTGSDPDGDPLTFSIQNRPGWATFSTSTGQLSGTPQPGDERMYTNIAISVSDGTLSSSLPAFSINVVAASGACTDCVDFTTVTTSSFAAQDMDSNFTILNGGASIRLDDNTWRQTDTTYTITPDTVVEFTFESSVQGEVHAIGFDEDNVFSRDRIFRVYGTQDLGISDFNTYSGSGPQTFTIPVGQYFTGSGFHLVIANDDDAGIGANGTFSDIRVYENISSPVPPVIDNPGAQGSSINTSVLLTVTATDANGDTLTFSATNLPNGLSIAPAGTISGIPTTLGTWSVTVTVDDGSGGTDSATFTWTITQNSPPRISGTPSPSVNVGQSYTFTPTASDPDGDNLSFSIQNKPSWALFDTSTGALSGTPQVGDAGSYGNILIGVSDGNLSDTLPAFTITVNQVSLGSTTLNWTPPTQNTDGSPLTNLAGFKIYYGTSSGNYPNQITINNPGVTTFVVDNLTPNTWYFVTTAFNSSGVESDVSNVSTKTIS